MEMRPEGSAQLGGFWGCNFNSIILIFGRVGGHTVIIRVHMKDEAIDWISID